MGGHNKEARKTQFWRTQKQHIISLTSVDQCGQFRVAVLVWLPLLGRLQILAQKPRHPDLRFGCPSLGQHADYSGLLFDCVFGAI